MRCVRACECVSVVVQIVVASQKKGSTLEEEEKKEIYGDKLYNCRLFFFRFLILCFLDVKCEYECGGECVVCECGG